MADADSSERDRPPLTVVPDEWPAAVADQIVAWVGSVRHYTVDNIVRAARALVYGLLAAAAVIALTVLFAVALVRLADAYLPIGAGVGSATWAAHGFIGLLVSVLGLGLWQARSSTARPLWIALVIDVALIIAVVFYGVIRAVA